MLLLRIICSTRNEAPLIACYASARLESTAANASAQNNDSILALLQEQTSSIKVDHPSKSNLELQASVFCDVTLSTLDDLYLHHAHDYLCSEYNNVADFFL